MLIKSSILLACSLLFATLASAAEYPVKITPNMSYTTVSHDGVTVLVKRIQDTSHKLVDDFAKTSRKCPPFCIQPMTVATDVKTIGEIELLNFVRNDVAQNKGMLIDARMPRFYQSETIPGSINIPFVLFKGKNQNKVLNLLGVSHKNKKYDFSNAKSLALYCNGPWCGQSPLAIKALLKAGYPASKLFYYRGGMQLWKIFSLTTILPGNNVVSRD